MSIPPVVDEAVAKAAIAASRRALNTIMGRWKLEILLLLNQRKHRFGELRRALSGITQHMLTTQLRELEVDGLVKRTVFAEVPPRVEYEITARAQALRPVFEALIKWMEENSATPSKGIGKVSAAGKAAASISKGE